MYQDIQDKNVTQTSADRPPGANYDVILYADDTIVISETKKSVEIMLRDIEEEAKYYGLKLNKKKCVGFSMNKNRDIKFGDGSNLPKEENTVYLGSNVNWRAEASKEVSRRISDCIVTWKRLGTFWKLANASVKIKLNIYDAMIRSKL
eukprot:8313877-Lingulodinium_polyedra.AAC.1